MAPWFNEEIHMNTMSIIWCAGILASLILAILYVVKQILNATDDMEKLNKQIDAIEKAHTEKKQRKIK